MSWVISSNAGARNDATEEYLYVAVGGIEGGSRTYDWRVGRNRERLRDLGPAIVVSTPLDSAPETLGLGVEGARTLEEVVTALNAEG